MQNNSSDLEVSIIFPTYNEKDNIVDLILETELYLSNHLGRSFEFIIIDDDSQDRTWQIVEERFRNDMRVRVIRRTEQKGLASAIFTGIQASRGRVVAWMDCDFSMPPYKLVELINKVFCGGYDICVGSRFIKGGRDVRGPADAWTAVILSRLMNFFISFLLGYSFKDYTSGFVAARKDIFMKVKFNGDYGEYFIDFIYKALKYGYKVIEIPYFCVPRRAGISKTGSKLWDYLNNGWKYVLLTLKLKFRTSKMHD